MRTGAITGHHNLSQKCAQLCSNVLEAAVVASGGFVLVKSARRVMTDLVVQEPAVGPANAPEPAVDVHQRNHTASSYS